MASQGIDEFIAGKLVEHGVPVGVGFPVGVNEIAEAGFGGEKVFRIQSFLGPVHFLKVVPQAGEFYGAFAGGDGVHPYVIVKQHEVRSNGFMTAVHDGEMAGRALQEVVKRFTIDVKPRCGNQVIKVGIAFLYMVSVFQKVPDAFLPEVRCGLQKGDFKRFHEWEGQAPTSVGGMSSVSMPKGRFLRSNRS